ncbi:MAG: phenylalanine--tRNA ligase subunit beta [gamma proteobacterium symbiont of Phacoides pectinatus]
MRFSEAWLREWVDPDVAIDALAEQLSMAGLEVDSVTPVAAQFEGVYVGAVLSREPHPDADKLGVCTVDVGGEAPLQVVCGAPNVAAGQRVPVALVGAVLPGGFKIKAAKLRGVESRGMICAESELGMADSSEGILVLPNDAPVGEDFRRYMGLDDQAIEVDLTPDRGDCLGLSGIAREVGVINRSPVTAPPIEPAAVSIEERFPVRVEAPAACPRYACRIVRNIDPDAQTPLWMQERLRRSGLRPISPVVDITNYVMLELGQPMHGFDLRQLDTEIQVRMARPGEKLVLLDGQEIRLRDDTLVIADASKAVAMAGIMGGEHSGVARDTVDILFESAFFAPTAIIGKSRSYGMHTDSSHRFERGVDPQLQVRALERATGLLLEMAGGEPGPVVEVVSSEHIEARPQILLRRNRVARVLGVGIDDATISDILTRLEMRVEPVEEGWRVTAPSCRLDINIEEDLIEEVGRIYGYVNIQVRHGGAAAKMSGDPETEFDLHRAKQLLVDREYQEVVTYSFISPEMHDLLDPGHGSVTLANPISADMSVMRTSLWPGLLQTALYNQSRQQSRIRIFESGLRFIKRGEAILQDPMLAGLICGGRSAEQWGEASAMVDFFDLKADLEVVLALTGCADGFGFEADEHPCLHPGQSANVVRNDEIVGYLGMLHPEIEKKLGLNGNAFVFELRLDEKLVGRLPAFRALSKFPSIRRDIAIVLDREISFARVRDCIQRAAPQTLQSILLFDVYTGEKVDSGRKSLALGLILQETSHTLTDEEVERVMARVLQALADELDAQLRD